MVYTALMTNPTCSHCGKPATLRSAYRSTYPRSPICTTCAGPVESTPRRDPWCEFHPYPINATLPLNRDAD